MEGFDFTAQQDKGKKGCGFDASFTAPEATASDTSEDFVKNPTLSTRMTQGSSSGTTSTDEIPQ